MVSLTKNAENTPDTVTIAASNTNGPCVFFMTHSVTSAKMPESRKLATTIIMPNNRMMVSVLIASMASGTVRMFSATTSVAPMMAA